MTTAHPGFDPVTLARIAPSLDEVVSAGDLSGAVTLVWRAGALAQVDCVGMRDIAAAAPMRRDTLFRIASMTKPVTSVAALMLIEAGKLRLDDPISRWLPEFAQMRVLRDPTGRSTTRCPRRAQSPSTICSPIAPGSRTHSHPSGPLPEPMSRRCHPVSRLTTG